MEKRFFIPAPAPASSASLQTPSASASSSSSFPRVRAGSAAAASSFCSKTGEEEGEEERRERHKEEEEDKEEGEIVQDPPHGPSRPCRKCLPFPTEGFGEESSWLSTFVKTSSVLALLASVLVYLAWHMFAYRELSFHENIWGLISFLDSFLTAPCYLVFSPDLMDLVRHRANRVMSAALMKEIQPVAFKHTWRLRPHVLDDHFYLPASTADYSLSSIVSYSLPRSSSQVAGGSTIPSDIYDYPSSLLPPSDLASRILLPPLASSSSARFSSKRKRSLEKDSYRSRGGETEDGERLAEDPVGDDEVSAQPEDPPPLQEEEEQEEKKKNWTTDNAEDVRRESWTKGKLIPPRPHSSSSSFSSLMRHRYYQWMREAEEDEEESSLRGLGESLVKMEMHRKFLTLQEEIQLLKEREKKKKNKVEKRQSSSASSGQEDHSLLTKASSPSTPVPTVNMTVYFPVAPVYAGQEEKQRHLEEELELLRLLSARARRRARAERDSGQRTRAAEEEWNRKQAERKRKKNLPSSSSLQDEARQGEKEGVLSTEYLASEEERERLYQERYRKQKKNKARGEDSEEEEEEEEAAERSRRLGGGDGGGGGEREKGLRVGGQQERPEAAGEMRQYDKPRDEKLEALENELRREKKRGSGKEEEEEKERKKKKTSWRERLLWLARGKKSDGDAEARAVLPEELIEKHTEFVAPQLLKWKEIREEEDRREEVEACARAGPGGGEGGPRSGSGLPDLSSEDAEEDEVCLRARQKRLDAFQRRQGKQGRPVLFYLHGGGLVMNDHHGYDKLLRRLTNLLYPTKALVIAIDYRLSPEFKFPYPLQDCLQAISFVVEHASLFDADPTRLALMGDSGGGSLAASVVGEALRRADEFPWIHHVRSLTLIYPSLCRGCATRAHITEGSLFYLKRDIWFSLLYSTSVGSTDDWRQKPFDTPDVILRQYPPTYIVLFTHDIMYDMGVLFHEKLRRQGVYTGLYIAPGFHGFFGSDRWSRFGVDSVEWTAENVIRHWEEKGEEEEEKEGRAAGHSRGKGLSN